MTTHLYTTAEVADRLGVSRVTVHRWVKAGRVKPTHTAGDQALFTHRAADKLIDKVNSR